MEKIHPLFNYDGHMNTMSGLKFNIFDPKPDEIDIVDIACGLSYKGHFCGQSPQYFSIAQHSLLVVDLLPYRWRVGKPDLALVALLHDAPEAYIGDMIKPIKIHFPLFKEIEDKIMIAISNKFNLKIEYMEAIKPYDKQAQEVEYNTFYAKSNHLNYLSPESAHKAFINKYYELIDLL